MGTVIFRPIQALPTGSSFVEFKSPSKNLANVKKDCPRLKTILETLLRLGWLPESFR